MWIKRLNQSLLSLIKVFLYSKIPEVFNRAVVNEAVILGNGPSLSGMISENAEFLKGKELFAVNYFALSDDYHTLRPRNYVMIDFTFYYNTIGDEESILKRDKLWQRIASFTTWEMNLYLPFNAKKHSYWKKFVCENKNIRVKYINVTAVEGLRGLRNYFFSKMLGMPRPHNVIIPSLMIAVKMGFKTIYLWGVDHSWLANVSVDENNVVFVNNKHFYDFNTSKPGLYILKNTPAARMHEMLYSWMCTFESYFIINDYASKYNVSIINQTPNSLIDAFVKKRIE
ncbi:MAG: hypothetical protein KBB11_06175 [Bacteroidales bacterium]|nr:hypothetical protein [Bacteroidales bacterium]HQP03042.1 hypothetical protein [Bacteroidales bacterium]